MGFYILKSLTFSSLPFTHPSAMHFSWQAWSPTEWPIIKDCVVEPFPNVHNRFTNVSQNLHASFFKTSTRSSTGSRETHTLERTDETHRKYWFVAVLTCLSYQRLSNTLKRPFPFSEWFFFSSCVAFIHLTHREVRIFSNCCLIKNKTKKKLPLIK